MCFFLVIIFEKGALCFFIILECYRYSVFLFQNIDRSNKGTIQFEDLVTTFALLTHGSIEDRLSWIFDLYDLNKDGKMTRMVWKNKMKIIHTLCFYSIRNYFN
jgi:hypothetical protein